MKLPIGPLRILQAGARANHRFGDRGHGFVLADHALMQFFFQVEQLLHFAFEQPRDRNAGPAADHCGDILFADFFLEELVGTGGYRFGWLRVSRSSSRSLPYFSSAARFRS